jgi:hypothetical protein
MTPQAKASKASAELELVGEAFERLRQNATDALFSSPAGNADYREALYRSVQTVNAVEKYLRAVIDDGAIEDFAESIREQLAPRA